jgi:TonB-linked SusC/RagA family outer membrane protein
MKTFINNTFMKKHGKLFLWVLLAFCLAMPQNVFAQSSVNVSGTITDDKGETLIGAAVQIIGSSIGTITDDQGRYSITVPKNSTLTVSSIGFKTQEVAVDGRNRIDIVMAPDAEMIDEVVFVAYGAQRKVTITGAVSNVGGNELLKTPAASLGNALAGKLPGVSSVQYSGRPGGDDPVIYVRGIGSLNGSSPLVLVDGVERSFNQIDPNEVEDITILKDASATAVFGVRGANGVILVTTKRGQEGKARINFSTSYGVQQVSNFIKMIDSYRYATLYNEAQRSDGMAEDQLRFSPEALQHFKDGDQPMLYPNVNWLDYVMKPMASQSQHNVSVSGGNKIARYFVSVGALTQDGLFRTFSKDPNTNFKYNRYNYRANVDLTLGKYNELSINLGGRVEDRHELAEGERNVFSNLVNAVPFSGYGIDEQGRRIVANKGLVGDYDNDGLFPFYGRGFNRQVGNILNLDLIYKLNLEFITPGLDFRIKGSYNSSYTQQKRRTLYEGVTYEPVVTDDGSVALRKKGDAWNLGYEESYWFGRDWYTEASFNYARKLGNHDISGLLLYNQSKTYYPGSYSDIPHGYVGLVGRVTYNYKLKYMADLNVGYNGSENFAPGHRYGLFPSFSAGWVASEEKFWKPVKKVISYLKIRASIGQVGNDNMNGQRFLYLPGTYQIGGGGYNFGLSTWLPGASEVSNGNPLVTWETATKQNYGIDIKFFDDRLTAYVDFFFEDRTGILLSNSATLPGVTAQKPSSVNTGRVKNKGYEIVLTWSDKVGKDFRYSISPSMTYARNTVIENGEVPPLFPHLSGKGYPVGQRTGYEFFEFYDPGNTEARYLEKYGKDMPKQMVNPKAGDCIYVDLTGDGAIDENDIHAMFYSDVPELNFTTNFNLSYKGFDFSMLWIGATNVTRDLAGPYRNQFGQMNRSAMMEWVADNSWTPETADTAILPRLSFTAKTNNTARSSVYFADASYIRLKSLEIGYTFQNIKFIPQVKGLRLYFSGYNLLTFSKFSANDPESATSSINYPLTRIMNIGLNLNF